MYARQRLAWFTLRVQEVSMVSYNFSFSRIYFNICASSIACGVDTANRINVMTIADHGLKNLPTMFRYISAILSMFGAKIQNMLLVRNACLDI